MNQTPIISDIGQYLTAFKIFELQPLINVLVILILTIAVILSLFLFIIGGIQWITSGGDKERITLARGRVMAAIIGLAIVLLSWAIYGLLGGVFRFPSVFQIPGGPGGSCAYCEHCESSSQKTHQCQGTIQDGVCKYNPSVNPNCTPCKFCGNGVCEICEGPDWCSEDCH